MFLDDSDSDSLASRHDAIMHLIYSRKEIQDSWLVFVAESVFDDLCARLQTLTVKIRCSSEGDSRVWLVMYSGMYVPSVGNIKALTVEKKNYMLAEWPRLIWKLNSEKKVLYIDFFCDNLMGLRLKEEVHITPFTYGQYPYTLLKYFFSSFYLSTYLNWFNLSLNKMSFLFLYDKLSLQLKFCWLVANNAII